ncbi:MAG: hypothetical protein AAF627_05180 [Myxococcota bacterium]
MEQIAEDVWGVHDSLWMAGGSIHFSLRTTIWRDDRGLVIHSPVRPGPWVEEVKKLGEVYAIMAPNLLHHLFVRPVQELFPEATLYGPLGLEAKRKNLRFDRLLEGGEDVFGSGVEIHKVAGAPKIEELVVYHGPSRTLIVTDLLFNMTEPQGWLTPWIMRMVGTYKRPAQSRLFKLMSEDKAAQARSLEPILALPFQRIVMAHGEVIQGDAETLAKAIGYRPQRPAALNAG